MLVELRRAIISRYFLIGFLICFLGLLFGGGSDLFELLSHPRNQGYAAFDLFDYAYNRSNSDWFFYVGAAIPFAGSYIEDKKSGYLRFILQRTSMLRFSIVRFAACALAGGLVVMLALLIFWGLCLLACPIVFSLDEMSIEELIEFGPYAQLLNDGNVVGFSVLYLLSQAFFGAFWAACAIALTGCCSRGYIAYIIPLFLGLLLIQVNTLTGVPMLVNPVFASQTVNFESPYFTFIYIIAIYAVYLLILYIIFLTSILWSRSHD